eukprot:714974-Prymnesium_polylepis.1
MTPATGPAASTTTSNVQLEVELRRAHSCSSHAVSGWMGRAGLGWSAALLGGSEASVVMLLRRQ